MNKRLGYFLRIVLIVFVSGVALSPLFAHLAELESLDLTPSGYMPVMLRPANTPTPSPTNTPSVPTPTNTVPSPAKVEISFIEFNPPGDDVENEFIEVTNRGGMPEDITGWYIAPTTINEPDGSGKILHDPFYFPELVLEGGVTVRVWTKVGVNAFPNYYWMAVIPIWLNDSDIAKLYNSDAQLVDQCTYSGGGEYHYCY
ncbi:MAG: lamin tail domain-containing protein [Candidatus Promineifilaceae bacterium]